MFVDFNFGRKIKEPNDLVWVHMTDYYPEKGRVRSRYEDAGDCPRMTVHGSLNHAVSGHTYGDWNDKKYLIASPFGDLIDRNGPPEQLNSVDTFFFGSLELPPTTIVLAEDRSKFDGQSSTEIKESSDSSAHNKSTKHLRQMVCHGSPYQAAERVMAFFGATYIQGGMWGWSGTSFTGGLYEEGKLNEVRKSLGLKGGTHSEGIYGQFEDAVRRIRANKNTGKAYWNGVSLLTKLKPDLPKKEMRDFAERELNGIRFPIGDEVEIYDIDIGTLVTSGFVPKGGLVTVV